MTHETAPSGQCLVQYLSPRWGGYIIDFDIGYYNNPLNSSGLFGWKEWRTGKLIKVIAYIELNDDMKLKHPWADTTQKQIFAEHGTFTPNFGNAGI